MLYPAQVLRYYREGVTFFTTAVMGLPLEVMQIHVAESSQRMLPAAWRVGLGFGLSGQSADLTSLTMAQMCLMGLVPS